MGCFFMKSTVLCFSFLSLAFKQPNDPYMGRRVLGSIPEQRNIWISQLWSFLYSSVEIFCVCVCVCVWGGVVKVCVKKLNPVI
jgi:hypothetical protein